MTKTLLALFGILTGQTSEEGLSPEQPVREMTFTSIAGTNPITVAFSGNSNEAEINQIAQAQIASALGVLNRMVRITGSNYVLFGLEESSLNVLIRPEQVRTRTVSRMSNVTYVEALVRQGIFTFIMSVPADQLSEADVRSIVEQPGVTALNLFVELSYRRNGAPGKYFRVIWDYSILFGSDLCKIVANGVLDRDLEAVWNFATNNPMPQQHEVMQLFNSQNMNVDWIYE